jgi:methyl-accepting chemotaxis protein/methyl-accepting chemotaxis protein-1 (serine sensor receptor)
MTIGKKLLTATGAMTALLLALAWVSLSSVGGLSALLDTAVTKTARKMEMVGEIELAVADLRAAQRGVILFSMMKNRDLAQKGDELFRGSAEKVRKLGEELSPALVTAGGKEALSGIERGLANWMPKYQEIFQKSMAGQYDDGLSKVVEETVSDYGELLKRTSELRRQFNGVRQAEMEAAAGAQSRSRLVCWTMILLSIAMGAVVVIIVRRINRDLREVARSVTQGAEQVASASSHISAASQSLAQGASEQAASLEETSASTEEISAMARRNTENSRMATENMSAMAREIEDADRLLAQMVVSMKEINQSSDSIAKVIKVIDEIAFQTNLLALNAAVEAARAGSAGMGFAVVADEVRNLAQRCAQSARDTASLIQESIARANDGKGKLDQVAAAFRAITDGASSVRTLVEEVNQGSQEQSKGVGQTAGAILQMQNVTQQIAANAEEGAAAGEQLSAQAATLNATVEQLQIMLEGRAAGASAPPARSGATASSRNIW